MKWSCILIKALENCRYGKMNKQKRDATFTLKIISFFFFPIRRSLSDDLFVQSLIQVYNEEHENLVIYNSHEYVS